jgi:hypothetical protein
MKLNKIFFLKRELLENYILNTSGHIFVALNLYYLGIIINKNLPHGLFTFWCDGIFGKLFLFIKGITTNKYRGVDLTKDLLNLYRNKKIVILGSVDLEEISKFNINIVYNNKLLNFDINNYELSSNKIDQCDAIFITLPSPMQEELASKIFLNYKKNIYCIGGAINMLTNPKLNSPEIINKMGMEFLFRLRSDFNRRLIRLIKSFYFLFSNIYLLSKIEVSVIE